MICSGASMLAHEANGCAFTEPNICAEPGPCSWKKPKPEGVAVELIDGCIRILDAFDFFHVSYNEEKTLDELMDEAKKSVLSKSDDISSVIAYLHYETSMLLVSSKYGKIKGMSPATFIIGALGVAFSWVREQGLDPLEILLEKHEFNKSRPYKHGKKF